MSFFDDLKFGQYFENLAMNYLKDKNGLSEICCAPNVKFQPYDFEGKKKDNIKYKFEVKADRMSRRTGNFFIEIESKSGKPSGLRTTEADYYLLILPNCNFKQIEKCFEIPVSKMLEFEKNTTNFRKSFDTGLGFLLSMKEIENYCI
jgi:hypothetical protein